MDIPKEKVEFLTDLGFAPDKIEQIKGIAARLNKSRKESGTLVREVTAPDAASEPVAAISAAPSVEEEQPAAQTSVTESFDREALLKELSDGLVPVLQPLVEAVQALVARQDALEAQVNDKLVKQLSEVTPKLSFGELLRKGLTSDTTALVDGRTNLGQAAPTPTPQPKAQTVTGVPFLDNMLARQISQ